MYATKKSSVDTPVSVSVYVAGMLKFGAVILFLAYLLEETLNRILADFCPNVVVASNGSRMPPAGMVKVLGMTSCNCPDESFLIVA